MKIYFDFEIHSKYSRACSAELNIPNIGAWAVRKGVGIVGTGDFTHPKWLSEIKENLEEDGSGLLKLKEANGENGRQKQVRYILSAEISSIYRDKNKTRRIHNLLLAPSIQAVSKIISALEKRGAKLGSDGRPIVGIPSKELLALVLEADSGAMLIPAHVWTPYFGLFGSMSGYDSVEECFEDLSPYIYALETGLSADPAMFWQISQFDKYTLVSCSDAHSLPRIGRECNLLDLAAQDFTYKELARIIKEKDQKKFLRTLEYYPHEGKYHFDGHRDCKFSCHPSQTKKLKGICPECGKKLTIGVLARVEELSDRPEGFLPSNAITFKNFVVLEEIIAAALGKTVASKKTQDEYLRMTANHNEFEILFDLPAEELKKITSSQIAEAIEKVRLDKVEVIPGYDGEYGKIKLFEEKQPVKAEESTLF